jgi:anaerobic magnesium-protoporphyrin IX monomethyl ester cyclase
LKIGLVNTALNEDAPPLNLVYLATALRSNGFSEVKIIDHTFKHKNLNREIKEIGCVGISAMTRYYNQARSIARHIKERIDIPVILGGSHITTASNSLSPEFTLGVIGEGENVLVDVCRVLQQEGSLRSDNLEGIRGIAYWKNARLVRNPDAELISHIDDLPLPDYSLLDKNYFRKKWIIWNGRMGRSMKILTSRGCPYNCVFCASSKIWKIVRLHSAQRIFQEVSELVEAWGVDHIYIDDDLFIINRERLQKFAELIEESGLNNKVSFFCSARSDVLDETICQVLKRIGVKVLNFGFESGSDKVLGYLKAGSISVNSHKQAIFLCKKYGLKIWGSFILGSPTENIDDMKKTVEFIDFAIANGCQRLGVFVATPLPGTEFWELARKNGKVGDDMNWDLIDYANSHQPLLLGPNVGNLEFRKIFDAITAKLDRLLLKDQGWKTIILRCRKVGRRILENPRRALFLAKNIFFRKAK